jgi:sugar phosphate isomerase/epimerase
MFKQGAFVNILTPDSTLWKSMLESVRQLPALDHVEVWIESIPKGARLKEFRDAFRGLQLIFHGPFLHTSLLSHIPEVVSATEDRFDATLDFASKVGARIVTFHAGTYPLFEHREKVLHTLAKHFLRFTDIKDPIATLENMPVKASGTTKEPLGHLSDCDQILKLLPNLRFTLDVGHSLQNGDDFVSFLETHRSRIEDIHLHDGIKGGKGHLRLGSGDLDLSCFLDALRAISFDKYVTMETISLEDTRSSWELLCRTEALRGIRDWGYVPSRR